MTTVEHRAVARRLTLDRLGSYLDASDGRLEPALALYDWNVDVGGAFHRDLSRFEVVFRNALDAALVAHGRRQGWPVVWYRRPELFPGKRGSRARHDLAAACSRAAAPDGRERHGKVIAELSFGFWRYLCSSHYLTSLWVPALVDAFPLHPAAPDPRRVRADVDDRVQRLHYLRNRIAHHEPVHQRDLANDLSNLLEVTGWMCGLSRAWIERTSRTSLVLDLRPGGTGLARADAS
ncbi:MAG: hypothetical protein S0880_24125 [Actinomycetota bacterium]|nr:hypothetical protein [Actinomycetota bacterium]